MRMVISGVSSGIGKETALFFARAGHTVYGLSRRPCAIEGVRHLDCDITDEKSVKEAARSILSEGDVDCLINNAGMGISGAYETAATDDIQRIFDVNVIGGIWLTQAFIPSLKRTRGRIINLSSVASVVPLPFQSFYSATKAAVDSLGYALAMELRPFGVKVTSVLPGDIRTGFTDARCKNPSEPDDYNGRIARSVGKMEKDERGGMPPIAVVKVINRAVTAKKPPLRIVVGAKYKVLALLAERMSKRLRQAAVYSLYGK